jgi:hypothetical protein
MTLLAPYYVVVDANVWVTERLLQSSIGSAFLYALTVGKSSIVLPEVVELEITHVLPEMAEKAVGVIGREISLLRQLSGHNLSFTAPTPLAIKEGIEDRWKQLRGLIVRLPFTHAQAQSALKRVLQKSAPSGENNEQFRDCCVWDAALAMAADREVHLITGDTAFYDGRSKTAGLARSLVAELNATKREIRIYPSLRDFLTAVGSTASSIDESAIGSAILTSVVDRARAVAAKDDRFELGASLATTISGYATPKPSLIAISFEVTFDLDRVDVEGDTETRSAATLTLKGVCSYDPTRQEVSEIEVREWSKSLKRSVDGIWGGSASPDRAAMERQYGPGRMRIIQ